ncbi:peptidoglycan DD-metalloendopeptidase family protein [Pseudomonadota bacterium]
MQKFFQTTAILTLVFVIFSCSQRPSAIEFKGYTFYGRDYYKYNGGNDRDNRRNLRASKNKEIKSVQSKTNQEQTKKETRVATVTKTSTCSVVPSGSKQIKVKRGDTLYGLAIKHKIPVKKLIEMNHLKEPYVLREGQKLVLSSGGLHVVQRGENLSTIARSYKMETSQIAGLNNLEKPYLIKVGQKLILPSGYKCSTTNVAQENQTIKKVAKNVPKTPIKEKPPLFKKNNFVWPVKGKVISKFGPKKGNLYNDGINVSVARATPFKATEDGVVAYVGNELKGYGNLIIIKHSNNWVSAYAHADEISVKRGSSVKRGDVIGKVGQTGNVDRPQLYFGLRKGRKALDPERYLR